MKQNSVVRKILALCLALAMCLALASCGNSDTGKRKEAAPVQSVSMLMGLDLRAVNRFSGVAEAKSSEKVMKDADKVVGEIRVKVGQEVKKGDVLFTYDMESVKLSVETAELEVEQLANSITSYDTQISELEKDKKSAPSSEKLSYSLQIQETQLDKAEAEYNLKQKQSALKKLKKSAEHTAVKAKVNGVIQSISQPDSSGGDSDYSGDSGSSDAFITIMETGTYRIKGTASETNVGELMEEMPVTVYSRTDYTQMWTGVISEIDTGSTEQEPENAESYDSDEGGGESAAKYSFYVKLDNSDGMMMGQHVYILPGTFSTPNPNGISLASAYLVREGDAAYLWAASSKDTLEKRQVTLGDYDEAADTYLITEGLSVEDYIAMPAENLTEGEAVIKYDSDSYGFSDGEEGDGSEMMDEGGSMAFDEGDMGDDLMDDDNYTGEVSHAPED